MIRRNDFISVSQNMAENTLPIFLPKASNNDGLVARSGANVYDDGYAEEITAGEERILNPPRPPPPSAPRVPSSQAPPPSSRGSSSRGSSSRGPSSGYDTVDAVMSSPVQKDIGSGESLWQLGHKDSSSSSVPKSTGGPIPNDANNSSLKNGNFGWGHGPVVKNTGHPHQKKNTKPSRSINTKGDPHGFLVGDSGTPTKGQETAAQQKIAETREEESPIYQASQLALKKSKEINDGIENALKENHLTIGAYQTEKDISQSSKEKIPESQINKELSKFSPNLKLAYQHYAYSKEHPVGKEKLENPVSPNTFAQSILNNITAEQTADLGKLTKKQFVVEQYWKKKLQEAQNMYTGERPQHWYQVLSDEFSLGASVPLQKVQEKQQKKIAIADAEAHIKYDTAQADIEDVEQMGYKEVAKEGVKYLIKDGVKSTLKSVISKYFGEEVAETAGDTLADVITDTAAEVGVDLGIGAIDFLAALA